MNIKGNLTSNKVKGLKPDKGLRISRLKKRKKYANFNKK